MSQLKAESTTIDGVTYEAHFLAPDDAVDLGVDLAKMAGGALAAAAKGLDAGEEDPDAKAHADDALVRAIESLVANADKATYRRIIETMMRVTFADGQPMYLNGQPLWKMHFAGKVGRLIKVVGFGIRVNFADFFGAGGPTLISALGRWGVRPPSTPSPSPPASVGGSGA